VILFNQAGRNRHEHICEALELFATQVMPEFHAMEPEHQAWKEAVLTGAIELEEIDTAPHHRPSLQTPGSKLAGAQT
jgi:hypothetical protein